MRYRLPLFRNTLGLMVEYTRVEKRFARRGQVLSVYSQAYVVLDHNPMCRGVKVPCSVQRCSPDTVRPSKHGLLLDRVYAVPFMLRSTNLTLTGVRHVGPIRVPQQCFLSPA